jgi:hypothetical protein
MPHFLARIAAAVRHATAHTSCLNHNIPPATLPEDEMQPGVGYQI